MLLIAFHWQHTYCMCQINTFLSCSALMPLQGEVLRIRRPHDYNPAAAKALGPAEPSPYINLALLSVLGGLVDEASAPRISVSGLPTALEEEQVGCCGCCCLCCCCC
jgi:hypothetical protein